MKTINVGEVTVFDHVEPNKEQALKPLEEAAEVFGAWQRWNETKNIADAMRVIDEISDTIQACVNLASAMGAIDLTYAMENCKDRNIERGRITEENPEALDADGEPIKVGDKLYFVEGDDTPLKCIGFDDYGNVTFTDWEKTRTIAYENPTVFTHKKPEALDADGVPIHVGDTVYHINDGAELNVLSVRYTENGCLIDVKMPTVRFKLAYFAMSLSHQKPDSWEQLETDAKLYCCEYFGRSYKECLECKADDPNHHPYDHPYDCNKAKTQDIVRRAKALAGVDDE